METISRKQLQLKQMSAPTAATAVRERMKAGTMEQAGSAYANGSGNTATAAAHTLPSDWDSLRREARKLEGEAEARVASYASDGSKADDQSAYAAEHVLERLAAVNTAMERIVPRDEPSKTHTLSRHKGVLQDLRRELQRARAAQRERSASLGTEREELLGGKQHRKTRRSAVDNGQLPPSVEPSTTATSESESARLTQEQSRLESASGSMEGVIDAASNTLAALTSQRGIIERAAGGASSISSRIPGLRNVMTQIRQKRNRDTYVLAFVIASCTLFMIIYTLR